jgi:hypothetical protein
MDQLRTRNQNQRQPFQRNESQPTALAQTIFLPIPVEVAS